MNQTDEKTNGWWIEQFITENRDGQNMITGKCDLKFCSDCLRVWSRVGLTAKQRYYSRKDVPYYGHPKKICKECDFND